MNSASSSLAGHYKEVSQSQRKPVLLRNLLENASRYSPLGSQIKITLEENERSIVLNVTDEGPGIDPDAAEELTQAFRRRDQRYGGSGLGLIARCVLPLRLN